jgi:hypothetical protein
LTTKKSNKKKIDTAQPIDPNSTNPVDIGHRFGIKIIEIMSQADVEQR